MRITKTPIEGLIEITPTEYVDSRGTFVEAYNRKLCKEIGISSTFVQDNVSVSKENVVRGMHFQTKYQQAKLVMCLQGAVIDYAVDLRKGSPTYSNYWCVQLSPWSGTQFYIPEGFAHGFAVIQAPAVVLYKVNNYRHPEYESGIHPKDPILNIKWPYDNPILSEKDRNLPFLADSYITL